MYVTNTNKVAPKPQVSICSTTEIINGEGTTYEPVSMEVD